MTTKQVFGALRLAMTAAILAILSVAPAPAQDQDLSGGEGSGISPPLARVPAPTANKCAVPLPEGELWLPQEIWAWEERLCLGERADMRLYFQTRLNRQLACDPYRPEAWPPESVLTSRFLEAIVRHPGYLRVVEGTDIEMIGYQDLLPDRGIEIFCAHFRTGLNLENAHMRKPLIIGLSRFENAVNLRRFVSDSFITFYRSDFESFVVAYAADIDDDFLIESGNVFKGPVNLVNAKTGGNLSIKSSILHRNMDAENVNVGGSLRLFENSQFSGVDLRRARVGNVLDLSESQFTGLFQADAMEVGGFVHIRRGATFDDVSMISASVKGSMDTVGAKFNGLLSAYGINIGGSLFLRGGATFHDVNLSSAVIGGSMELRGSEYLGRLDLTNARIEHELQVASPLPADLQTDERQNYEPPRWGDQSELILRNLSIEALQDTAEAWDNLDGRLDLVGFTYLQLGGLRATRDSILAARSPAWMLDWLAKQKDRAEIYQPQPYEQLAKVLREGGWIEKSADVLIARGNYQLMHPTTPWATKVWLAVKWAVIGYGLEVWLSIVWLIGLQVIGTFVMGLSKQGREIGWVRSAFYSIDTSMPFVDLNPVTHNELSDNSSQGMKFYFGAQRVIGLILVTFLAAGMSGLTQ